jgi:hypothetical protein
VGTNTAKTGKSYVVFGKQDTDPIELSAITAGKGGFIINDESGRNFSGCLVSSAGDVNGDGLDDLIISAIYSGDQDNRFKPGKSYVVFGKKDNTAINLSDIAAGTGGFVINGESVYLIIQWHWCCLFFQIRHMIYLRLIYYLDRLHEHPQLNHLSHRH